MSSRPDANWANNWSTDHKPYIDFAFAPVDVGGWVGEARSGLESVELGLGTASAGVLGARRVRAVPSNAPVGSDWQSYDADFEFIFVLSGSLTIENEAGEHYTLGPGAAGVHPARFWYRRYEMSPDLEYVHITAPAAPTLRSARDAPPGTVAADRKATYTFDTADNYTLGAGPRGFFKYRDLKTAQATDGRIHIHVVRATAPGEATGWHYHSMSQWFMVVGGSATIYVEDVVQPLGERDAMCLGEGMRHDVAPWSGDYAVLEMCVPAQYDTISVARPGAAEPSAGPAAD